jgi:plastocyanin
MDAHDVGRRLVAVLAVLTLATGCASSASLNPTPTSTPAPTPSASLTPSASPTPSASQPAALPCAETPNVAPSATVQWTEPVVGAEPTIKAGQAVEFVTTGFSPTVTEWTNGKPADNPCIDKTIGSDATTMKVVVTFYQPGDYNITCRKTPEDMHTVVHVQ